MSEPIVAVERLGKKYRIQHNQARQPYIALRDVIAQKLSAPMRWFSNQPPDAIPAEEDFWALKDVSFDVAEGDVVGIIGRNGAGKSTLLKVLSRITDPTEGRVTLRGRAGSLLEVGTGFHPELTGRDNIFLNGAILGMQRAEITRKFDEIVAFSGVERFLDTPVKRYSSGMHVRLAFAVAAHLEPEILIVDEVLSVGDAEFQQKCLGKMGEVARSGRTVLFVSHHLATVENLCKTCILLERGRVKVQGPAHQVIAVYASDTSGVGHQSILERTDRRGNGVIRFSSARLLNEAGQSINAFKSGQTGIFELQVNNPTGGPLRSFHVSVGVDNLFGQRVTTWSSAYTNGDFKNTPSGNFAVQIKLPRLALIPGQYTYNLFATVSGDIADWLLPGGSFEVEAGDFYGSGQLPDSEDGAYMSEHAISLR